MLFCVHATLDESYGTYGITVFTVSVYTALVIHLDVRHLMSKHCFGAICFCAFYWFGIFVILVKWLKLVMICGTMSIWL